LLSSVQIRFAPPTPHYLRRRYSTIYHDLRLVSISCRFSPISVALRLSFFENLPAHRSISPTPSAAPKLTNARRRLLFAVIEAPPPSIFYSHTHTRSCKRLLPCLLPVYTLLPSHYYNAS
jgi:hypothetical protein